MYLLLYIFITDHHILRSSRSSFTLWYITEIFVSLKGLHLFVLVLVLVFVDGWNGWYYDIRQVKRFLETENRLWEMTK